VEDPGIVKLFEKLLDHDEFVELYQRAPGGKRWHHGYLGGLLEHTASMMKLANRVADHYSNLNRDLLLAGTFLHDVGKLSELRFDTTIEYTVRGRLVGHLVLGAEMIEAFAEEIEELDPEAVVQIKHMVLSHQGSYENGCPVLPKTREAFVLYYLDELYSKLNALDREFEKAAGGGGYFTDHIRLLDRMLYKGGADPDDSSF
jgi:3'-5' exoribonuclease